MESFVRFLLLGCFLINTSKGIISAVHENKILKDVILKYPSDVRPSLDRKVAVNVTLDITFNNIIDVDEKHQILTSSIWVRQSWTSALTSWNVSDYGDLTEIIIDAQKIWQPDTVLYNNVFEEFSGRLDETVTRVRLSHNGFTFWAAPFIFKTLCKINVANFPFDTQICKLTFGSWQYNSHEVNIKNSKETAAIAKNRVESGEWEVLKVLIDRKVIFYQCCPNQPYPEISFVIHMKRRPLFYVVNLILPNILISLLAFFSFFIPVECGERISFVITVLLSMTVFMLLVADSIPPTSDAVPVIGIFYTFSIFEVFLALLATGISLKINYSYMFGDGLSPKLQKFLFHTVGPCLRFDVQKILDNNSKEKPRLKSLSCSRGLKKAVCCNKSQLDEDEQPKLTKVRWKDNCQSTLMAESGDKDLGLFEGRGGTELNNLTTGNLHNRQDCEAVANDVAVISASVKDRKDQMHKVTESKLAAAIIDRVFLWVFVVTYLTSTFLILLLPVATS